MHASLGIHLKLRNHLRLNSIPQSLPSLLHHFSPTMFAQSTRTTPSFIQALSRTQVRHASLLRRPKRPYTFTQLITLSDGSTFVHRTTSPQPVYRSTKDVRNSPLWNPSSQKLMNIEEDEAGRLKRFRGRFGRGWDAEAVTGSEEVRLRAYPWLLGGLSAGRDQGVCAQARGGFVWKGQHRR